jgi:uncharacterized protein YfkK (UPF0435 family)
LNQKSENIRSKSEDINLPKLQKNNDIQIQNENFLNNNLSDSRILKNLINEKSNMSISDLSVLSISDKTNI